MVREGIRNPVLQFRNLFRQYVVDMYAKVESERLLYIGFHQQKLRVDNYVHLRDAVSGDGNVADVGKMVVLPATFVGSPRHMQEYAQDGMCYVRKHGRPDLFITFTCNPKWDEISAELEEGQSATDRHDIIARVFRQKMIKLIDVLKKWEIFGPVKCFMCTVEWQKRGLPHLHLLLWLSQKIHPSQIDEVICSELPDPLEDPILFDIIVKSMIHGPCGVFNPKCPCMKNNACTKGYPRAFVKETVRP